MACHFFLLMLLFSLVTSTSASDEAYPTNSDLCTADTLPSIPIRREVYGDGRIFDITHRYKSQMPFWETDKGLGQFLWFPYTIKNGSLANSSMMKMFTHSGTHVDAPGHIIDRYFDSGFDVDTLDLETLNGSGLLVDVPRDSNITAEAMKSLSIPIGVRRVLFRTLNTDREIFQEKGESMSTLVAETPARAIASLSKPGKLSETR